MQLFLVSFLASFVITFLIVRYEYLHHTLSADDDLLGVQKIHVRPVPRVGGVGIFLALQAGGLFLYFARGQIDEQYWWLVACALVVFAGGLGEDLTKKISPLMRISIIVSGAALAAYVLGAVIPRAGIAWLDPWFAWYPLALLFTFLAVTGLTNAVNIIDGFNGLASAVCLLYLIGLAYVSFQVHDQTLTNICLVLGGGLFGFFVFNWPRGLIFLGDGGAYLLGFLIAEISVLLVVRNAVVSAWFPLLLIIYPVCETLLSIYRRAMRRHSPIEPDGLHLHMLIFRRIVRRYFGLQNAQGLTLQNSMTSPYLWGLSSLSVIPAMMFWQHTKPLIFFILLFVFTYVWLYWRIVRFRTPWFLRNPRRD